MRLSPVLFGFVALLAIGIALASTHYLIFGSRFAPPGIGTNFDARPLMFLMHVAGGIVALTVGIWQFLPRTRRSAWHRLAGRVYVIACLLGGIGGLVIAFGSTAGPIAQTGFAILAVLWIVATLKAYLTIRSRNVATHRIWMWRSFGLTSAAITLRLILVIGQAAGYPFEDVYLFSSWACWISSLAIAETTRLILDTRKGAIPAATPGS